MKRGKKPKRSELPAGSSRPWRRLVVVALTLAAAAGLVWGVARLGELARSGLGPRDRYAVRFADVQCDAPPRLDRAAFLTEVRYVSDFPETFQSLDPDSQAKLAAAFAAHPWVEKVNGVVVGADNRVRVELAFRRPALAVLTTAGPLRVVDATGVLLPSETSADGLPELASAVESPKTPAGQVWADPDVKRAGELVEAHHPRRLEKSATGWRLTTTDGKTLVVEK